MEVQVLPPQLSIKLSMMSKPRSPFNFSPVMVKVEFGVRAHVPPIIGTRK